MWVTLNGVLSVFCPMCYNLQREINSLEGTSSSIDAISDENIDQHIILIQVAYGR